ncbi:MAG: DEAD/DEAH box helicase, partial [Clostridia bacterium]|nr:DEAD/DEAH box helicase [Clostridia bacterium]
TINKYTYFNDFVSKFENVSFEDYEIPKDMEHILRPYQKTGFKWLKLLASFGLGGILADEMGLGKTLQAIAFVKSEYEKTKKPTLIVAPTSLLYNWYNEIKKFSPDSSVCIISGDPAERKALAADIDKYCFVITSYGLLRRDAALYANASLAYCIIDEAQQIKNPNTINAKAVKSLKAQGFFALTGTPLENNLTELWSIFDFVMPGYLFSRHKFRTMYEIPIVKEENKNSLNELLKHTKPFILRRLKSQVMSELPQKIESKIVCEPTQKQKLLYTAYASAAKKEINTLIDNGNIARNHIKILSMITRLRQLCCHPSLFVENYNGGSGKLDVLIDLLESSIDSGHRVLIFSQFTSMLSIIADTLNEIGISYFYLDGHTPSKSRVEMADKFNSGEKSVFLISLKAGGTGLNLTGADMVIHFDPWWNPAVENQATDRVHRIGQTKSVQVMKFVAKDTIEEKIHEIQQIKQNMIDNVLETGETLLSSMTIDEIKSLFE